MLHDAVHPDIHIAYPAWVDDVVDWSRPRATDEERMTVAIAVARANVTHATGGPFGAAIFEQESGRLVSIGVNGVVRHNNSALHAEMMAFMMAERRVGCYTLHTPALPAHELHTSCAPCAMCLGAALWSGVRRIVIAAARDDAASLGFDEGPVFPETYRYLEERGIALRRDVLRDEARAVLERYERLGGTIYNG